MCISILLSIVVFLIEELTCSKPLIKWTLFHPRAFVSQHVNNPSIFWISVKNKLFLLGSHINLTAVNKQTNNCFSSVYYVIILENTNVSFTFDGLYIAFSSCFKHSSVLPFNALQLNN